jgi:hypothetical protein
METTTTTTTTVNPDIYRFGGFKFQLQAPDRCGFNEIIPQVSGSYAFPKGDEATDPSIKIYEPDSPV